MKELLFLRQGTRDDTVSGGILLARDKSAVPITLLCADIINAGDNDKQQSWPHGKTATTRLGCDRKTVSRSEVISFRSFAQRHFRCLFMLIGYETLLVLPKIQAQVKHVFKKNTSWGNPLLYIIQQGES